jgi:hypothetical protein
MSTLPCRRYVRYEHLGHGSKDRRPTDRAKRRMDGLMIATVDLNPLPPTWSSYEEQSRLRGFHVMLMRPGPQPTKPTAAPRRAPVIGSIIG